MTVAAAPEVLLATREVQDARTWGRIALITAICSVLVIPVLGPFALAFGLTAQRAMRRAGIEDQRSAFVAIVIGWVDIAIVLAAFLAVALGGGLLAVVGILYILSGTGLV